MPRSCPECKKDIQSSYAYLDRATALFEVDETIISEEWHPACLYRYKYRMTQKAQVDLLAAALIEACKQSPLKELIATVGHALLPRAR